MGPVTPQQESKPDWKTETSESLLEIFEKDQRLGHVTWKADMMIQKRQTIQELVGKKLKIKMYL